MTERFGTWCLDALLAAGAVAEIWRASRERHDQATDVVALKRLHTHLVRNPEVRSQFLVEQRLTTTLPRHPNLVHASEAGEIGGRPYIALALAPGDDLRRQFEPSPVPGGPGRPAELRSSIVLPRVRALAIAAAACDAAAHLHDHGFVHGDINPSNLVVATDDRVTLIDLGLACEVGRAGAVRGTHAYMAPEQVHGRAWTRATDVFALAVVLWELVAGTRLFHRGPPWLSMAAVVEDAVPPLADPALDAIAQAALAKDPDRRIATAGELAARLRALG